jgi:Protein of unknown function (DUF2726)
LNYLSSYFLLVFFVLALILIFYVIKSVPLPVTDEQNEIDGANEINQADEVENIWPFYLKQAFTRPERVLYHRLVNALPDRIVLAQVHVARMLGIKKEFYTREWINRLNRMSYDFVILSNDFSILAVIELADISHENSYRVIASRKKEKATLATGTIFIRWNVSKLPDETAIQATIANSSFS